MLSKAIEFNIGVLIAHGGPNGKTTAFPVITCRNESVEIAAIGVAAGGTEKGSPVVVIAVKNPERGGVDIETASEAGRRRAQRPRAVDRARRRRPRRR